MISEHLERAQLLREQGRPADAERLIRQHLAQEPNDPNAHALLASCLLQLDKYDEAQASAQTSIHLAPDQPFAYSILAAVLLQKNRFDEALQAVDAAIRLNPLASHLWGIKAHVHLSSSQWQPALEAAEQGLQLDAEDSTCANARTSALVQLGRRSEAFQSVDSVLAREPENADAHASKGWALLHAGDGPAAEHHFREALRLEPGNDFARRGILEALKSRSWLYRQMLRYFLFMSRLSGGAQWGIILGLYIAMRLLGGVARNNPDLAPFIWPLLIAYGLFVVLSWAAQPLFNLFLRLHPLGKYALDREDRLASTLIGLCLGGGLLLIAAGLLLDKGLMFAGGIGLALLLFPVSAVFNCASGWPRWGMIAYLGGLVAVGCLALFGLATGQQHYAAMSTYFLLGTVLSTFVGNLLSQQVPKK